MSASLGARPGPHPFGDATVLVVHLARRQIEDRGLRDIRVPMLRGPVGRAVDVLLPRGVGHQRPLGTEGVEHRAYNRLAAAYHPSDRAHPRVDHGDSALSHAQAAEILDEAGASHGLHVTT